MDFLAPVLFLVAFAAVGYFIYKRITRVRPEPTEEDRAFQKDMMERWDRISRENAGLPKDDEPKKEGR